MNAQPFYDWNDNLPTAKDEFKTIFTIEGDFADWVHNWLIPFSEFNGLEDYFDDEWKQEQIDDNFGLGDGVPDVDEQDYYGYFAEQAFWEVIEYLGMACDFENLTFILVKDKVILVDYTEFGRNLSYDEIYARAW